MLADDTTSGLAFQLAPDHQPPAWPDPARPQQMHLDVMVEDLAAPGPRALALGAAKLDFGPGVYARTGWAPVLPDPEAESACSHPGSTAATRYHVHELDLERTEQRLGAMNGLEFAKCTDGRGIRPGAHRRRPGRRQDR